MQNWERASMGTEQLTPAQVIEQYRPDTIRLLDYVVYLEKMKGCNVSSKFDQDGLSKHSVTFPVYDATLLRFVKDAENTVFMNRNYRYTYTRMGIKDEADERRVIENCTIRQLDVIGDILSKYVMGGRTKGTVWSEGVRNGVYLAAITKAYDLIHFWENEKEG